MGDFNAWLRPVPAARPMSPGLDCPRLQLANIGQYLLAEHSEDLARIPENLSPKAWLIEQLDLAEQWGWQTPEQLHFLVVERLREMHTPGITNWSPRPDEQAQAHFERLRSELLHEIKTWP